MAAPVSHGFVSFRVAHPVRDLQRSSAFYGGLLKLRSRGGFQDHQGYSGAFFALPGGGELELTTGPDAPRPGTDDDLLVLYTDTLEEAKRMAADLTAARVPSVRAVNPYWERWGSTFRDPDGYLIVIAAVDRTPPSELRIEPYAGERERLRPLFALAEDSPAALNSYLLQGRVLVAITGANDIVGHVQLVGFERQDGRIEVKSLAVREDMQRCGIGARLIEAAVAAAKADGAFALTVSTAAADVDNLHFYQQRGFRMHSVQWDAFTAATGYPQGLRIHGIELRDRVWLERALVPVVQHPPAHINAAGREISSQQTL